MPATNKTPSSRATGTSMLPEPGRRADERWLRASHVVAMSCSLSHFRWGTGYRPGSSIQGHAKRDARDRRPPGKSSRRGVRRTVTVQRVGATLPGLAVRRMSIETLTFVTESGMPTIAVAGRAP